MIAEVGEILDVLKRLIPTSRQADKVIKGRAVKLSFAVRFGRQGGFGRERGSGQANPGSLWLGKGGGKKRFEKGFRVGIPTVAIGLDRCGKIVRQGIDRLAREGQSPNDRNELLLNRTLSFW